MNGSDPAMSMSAGAVTKNFFAVECPQHPVDRHHTKTTRTTIY